MNRSSLSSISSGYKPSQTERSMLISRLELIPKHSKYSENNILLTKEVLDLLDSKTSAGIFTKDALVTGSIDTSIDQLLTNNKIQQVHTSSRKEIAGFYKPEDFIFIHSEPKIVSIIKGEFPFGGVFYKKSETFSPANSHFFTNKIQSDSPYIYTGLCYAHVLYQSAYLKQLHPKGSKRSSITTKRHRGFILDLLEEDPDRI